MVNIETQASITNVTGFCVINYYIMIIIRAMITLGWIDALPQQTDVLQKKSHFDRLFSTPSRPLQLFETGIWRQNMSFQHISLTYRPVHHHHHHHHHAVLLYNKFRLGPTLNTIQNADLESAAFVRCLFFTHTLLKYNVLLSQYYCVCLFSWFKCDYICCELLLFIAFISPSFRTLK